MSVQESPVSLVGRVSQRLSPVERAIRSVEQQVIGSPRKRGRVGSLDVVLLFDTTGSMGGVIEQAQQFGADFMDLLADMTSQFRIAVVEYKDRDGGEGPRNPYAVRVTTPLTSDRTLIQAGLNELVAEGGFDRPEDVFLGLQTAFALEWDPAAHRVVIILGDAWPHEYPEEAYYYGDYGSA